jgi:hypothetical protein
METAIVRLRILENSFSRLSFEMTRTLGPLGNVKRMVTSKKELQRLLSRCDIYAHILNSYNNVATTFVYTMINVSVDIEKKICEFLGSSFDLGDISQLRRRCSQKIDDFDIDGKQIRYLQAEFDNSVDEFYSAGDPLCRAGYVEQHVNTLHDIVSDCETKLNILSAYNDISSSVVLTILDVAPVIAGQIHEYLGVSFELDDFIDLHDECLDEMRNIDY